MTLSATGHSSSAPLILTGADQRFSRSLAQLLLSAKRHGAHRRYRWAAFDLGIAPDTLCHLQKRFDWCDWHHVPFEDLPPHYRPETRSFAWKPWAIWQILQRADAPVLWLDSATVIKGDLQEIYDWANAHGVYAARGRSIMRHRCEPQVMQALGFPPNLVDTREIVANLICFDPANKHARLIAQQWEQHARTPDLLLPTTNTVERHMNDQAVLNCLLLPLHASGDINLPDIDADISAGNPYKMVSTRNKIPLWVPLWADPLARLWYWTYKAVDQALWRRRDREI